MDFSSNTKSTKNNPKQILFTPCSSPPNSEICFKPIPINCAMEQKALFPPNNFNQSLDKKDFLKNNNDKSNNCDEDKSEQDKYKRRLNILKLVNDQSFDDYFIFGLSQIEEKYKLNREGYNPYVPYVMNFKDYDLLQDESLYYMCNGSKENKFLNNEDLKSLESNQIKMDFGDDPFNIYHQIDINNDDHKQRNLNILCEILGHFHRFNAKKCGFMTMSD